MTETNYSYFVAAAVVASKLNAATHIAKNLSLTASNARAVALRAGMKAAGFRPLTDFIDRLANITISSSLQINQIAAELSKIASNKFRTDSAIGYFEKVYQKAKDSPYIDTLSSGYRRTVKEQSSLGSEYRKKLIALTNQLEQLKDELRTAIILATLSRVEASQAGPSFEEQLKNVADNVEQSADIIREYISSSLQLVSSLEQERS
ncbi:hypothetical protein [Thalassotalea ganghwensis]